MSHQINRVNPIDKIDGVDLFNQMHKSNRSDEQIFKHFYMSSCRCDFTLLTFDLSNSYLIVDSLPAPRLRPGPPCQIEGWTNRFRALGFKALREDIF